MTDVRLDGIRAVVFDMFQTLFHSPYMNHREVLAEMLQVPFATVRQAFHEMAMAYELGAIDARQRMEELCRRVGRMDIDAGMIDRLIHEENKACIKNVTLYPGVSDLIPQLKRQGYLLALCSNCNPIGVEIANFLDLPDQVQTAAFSCQVGAMKPDPRMYQAVTKGLGIPPQQCLFVDDGGSRSIQGAWLAGMVTVLVRHSDGHAAKYPDEQFRADFEIDEVAQVASLLPRPATIL